MTQGWPFPPAEGESPALMLQQLRDFGGLLIDLHPDMKTCVDICRFVNHGFGLVL